ncbi:Uncharacterized conserved protein, conains N-terminal glutamine amidotransferase (GATase1)-like domain [Brevinema andersonii]|uniref:Uncharacterized conserved protein, conains N-terminal glutamine amidotransferase (GATase1)-like domain n=1 Tax=Brevinema andersonii TaxID=34097 RepID=A0A1I1E1L1_BREAD|nr:BPL-N domain-containing protein [Brevinema andersonii]SFB78743.1 Uncharacterized conserved protein, conains N-terminal glutamine amidotransferase (GATase1)-like domain [Brevinema andersonii]
MERKILIYGDEGTSILGVHSFQIACSEILKLPCEIVDSNYIVSQDWYHHYALIIPGGEDIPYCSKLNGIANTKIKEYVRNGGFYLGICAGAYYASKTIEFTGESYQVFQERELAFFEGVARGSLLELTGGYHFSECSRSKAIVNIRFLDKIIPCFYHGGPYFDGAAADQILGYFLDLRPAIIHKNYGNGSYLLSAVHFENQLIPYRKFLQESSLECIDILKENLICFYLAHKSTFIIWEFIANIMISQQTVEFT